ncbi:MAG: type II toxin-antitoxin system prevent-host-death family antitoxin [Actinomycetota bacterium]|nr:type II toxin-antitoxin system prevent-host-death family antitoxin [Actinomycetota bacterium]
MKTINQRELRNDSAEVMRQVEQGQSYTVTRRGVPVARLSPVTDDADLRCLRAASRHVVYSETVRVTTKIPSEEIVTDLRGER